MLPFFFVGQLEAIATFWSVLLCGFLDVASCRATGVCALPHPAWRTVVRFVFTLTSRPLLYTRLQADAVHAAVRWFVPLPHAEPFLAMRK